MGANITTRQSAIGLLLLACLVVVPLAVHAQDNPQQLVKQMVYNELHAQKHPNFWMYRDSDQQSGTTKVMRVVETPQCWFQWTLSENGQPLSAEKQKQQEAEIQKLVTDGSACKKNRAEIDQDGKQAEDLMKILPDAFLYTEDGEQDGNLRLKFKPNPQFDPASKAAKVFHAMEGTLLINKKNKRLAGISGTLMQDVTFGAGILGRLYKGGTFNVRQRELAPDDCEVTLLDVQIRGRALFFHTISEQQHDEKSNFEPVPSNMSLARAADIAEHGNPNVSAAAQ